MSGTSSRYRKNYPVSWEQLQRDCRALAWKLLDVRSDWSRIVAVARGGLVPAAVIARELNIRLVDTVCISSYTMRDQSASADILKRPDLAGVDETCLVIDDLVDTGKTAKIVREMFGAAHFATVYAKPAGRALVDSFVTEVSQDTWVLFPWDAATAADFVPPIAEIRREMPRDERAVKIRKAEPRDVEATKRIYRQIIARLAELAPCYRTDCEQDEEFIKKSIERESSDILVAELDGAITAFALIEERETAKLAGVAPRRYAFLMDICVDEKLRGQGVGSALLAACEEWARGRGLEYLELNVLEANEAARRLYERTGYKKIVNIMRMEL